jgi:hypothetical protein
MFGIIAFAVVVLVALNNANGAPSKPRAPGVPLFPEHQIINRHGELVNWNEPY